MRSVLADLVSTAQNVLNWIQKLPLTKNGRLALGLSTNDAIKAFKKHLSKHSKLVIGLLPLHTR